MINRWTCSSDGMLGGVLSGLGKYLNINPTIIRIVFMILWVSTTTIPFGLIYLILWMLLPEEK